MLCRNWLITGSALAPLGRNAALSELSCLCPRSAWAEPGAQADAPFGGDRFVPHWAAAMIKSHILYHKT